MTNLLKEAIADAKAVRETALANAKLALEEAFTPRLQSMLSARLAEEEDDDIDLNTDADFEREQRDQMAGREDNSEMNMPMEGDYGDDMDESYEEDMDETLEAIIRELEGEEMEEELDASDIGAADNELDPEASYTEDPGEHDLYEAEDEDIDINEIIEALREEEELEEEEEPMEEAQYTAGVDDKGPALEESYRVIRFLKSKINEVNLLNAKLLFSNKLFKNHSLNENQKMKVIENFDRATTLREVKLVYSTLAESFNVGKSKRQIKESRASKPAGRSTAPKKEILSESNDMVARWKKLANLK